MTKRAHHVVNVSLAVFLSAIGTAATTFGVVQKFVYTREEGLLLEDKVKTERIERRQDMSELRTRLDAILAAVRR